MILLFFEWFYATAPKLYLNHTKRVTHGLLNFFSITLLTRTLFDPWRHDQVDVANLPLTYWFQAFTRNLTSRVIGFSVRAATIVTGFAAIVFYNTAFGLFIVMWYSLPLWLVGSLILGFRLLGGVYG